jgi:hypothetical protein
LAAGTGAVGAVVAPVGGTVWDWTVGTVPTVEYEVVVPLCFSYPYCFWLVSVGAGAAGTAAGAAAQVGFPWCPLFPCELTVTDAACGTAVGAAGTGVGGTAVGWAVGCGVDACWTAAGTRFTKGSAVGAGGADAVTGAVLLLGGGAGMLGAGCDGCTTRGGAGGAGF